jgi:hypothetical protein
MKSGLWLLECWLARRGSSVLPMFVMCILLGGMAWGQPVTVRIINGRNGKPLPKVRVYIGFDDLKGRQSLDLTTDAQGELQFEANGAKTIQVHPVGEVTCGEQPVGAPYRNYSIEEILKDGLLTKNDCSHISAEPLRGKLLYFVRPATGWELFKN